MQQCLLCYTVIMLSASGGGLFPLTPWSTTQSPTGGKAPDHQLYTRAPRSPTGHGARLPDLLGSRTAPGNSATLRGAAAPRPQFWGPQLVGVENFSERELTFTFAICSRPSVCLHCLSVCRLSSVTLVHPTQAVEIFGNIYTALYLVPWCIRWHPQKISRRSSQGNPSAGGDKDKRGSKI